MVKIILNFAGFICFLVPTYD